MATWSLRERAVCSRSAASPIFSRRRGLDVHVHVLELAPEDEAPRLDLLPDLLQPPHDGLGVGGGDDALAGQHAGVGDGAGDVLLVQPPVDVDGGGEGLRPRVGGLAEARRPDLGRLALSHG